MNSTTNVEPIGSILNDPEIRSAVYAAARVTVSQFPHIESNPHGLDADDLASHAFERIVSIEKQGRLHKDLRQHGYPAKGEPRSLPGVVFTATAAWGRGYISEEAEKKLPGFTWQEAREAVRLYDLVGDAPDWNSMPDAVRRLGDQLTHRDLSDANLGIIERDLSKNAGRAYGVLATLELRQRHDDDRAHDGPGLRPVMTPEIEQVAGCDVETPYAEESEPELYGLLVDLGGRDDYGLVG
ncbi:hypothetical protein L5G28_16335 [Gordonia sp. HY285]|uniref:hypothetical protein n=1 Tax=Gordonia liuliyuniae TaxID=2911517 RepID=UPI001F36A242|nr:hypothetical protein [Gordonia liuliyuniae]MCF8611715.1 hypothetical protein [Gordonia liuliyuniae]